jgi:hypothetical protein
MSPRPKKKDPIPRPVEPRPGEPIRTPVPGEPIRTPLPKPLITYWRSACNFQIEHRHYTTEQTSNFLKESPRALGYSISTLSSKSVDLDMYLDLCLPPNVTIKRISFPYETEGNNQITEINLSILGEGSYSAFTETIPLKSSTTKTYQSPELTVNVPGAAILTLKVALRGQGDTVFVGIVKITTQES